MYSVLRIAEQRKKRGMTQAALAAQIGVNPSTVARWESGERNPELSSLLAVAQIFQCPPGDLFRQMGPYLGPQILCLEQTHGK